MLKFFAKYQKIILVVGGSLLMVVFLLPAGGEMFMPNPAKQAMGYIDDDVEVIQSDIAQAEAELNILSRLNRMWDIRFEIYGIDALTWHLLMHEARSQGIYFSYQRAQTIAQDYIEGVPGLGEMLINSRGNEALLARALQHMMMFEELERMTMQVQRVSTPRIAHYARDTRSTASARVVPVRAEQYLDQVDEPTDAQIKAHFDKYKEQLPGESEPYGFGYRYPNRFKLEFIAVPVSRVAATVEVDDLMARKYYRENRSQFMPAAPLPGLDLDPAPDTPPAPEGPALPEAPATLDTPATPDTPEDADAPAPDAPADAPAEGAEPEQPEDEDPADAISTDEPPQDPNAPLPYAQVRDRVFNQLRDQLAGQKRDRIVQYIVGELTTDARRNLESGEPGYLKVTKDFKPLSLEKVQEAVSARPDFNVLVDFERIENEWLTPEDLAGIGGLGDSYVDVRGTPVPIQAYVLSAKEFGGDTTGPLATLRLQAKLPSRPVYDAEGNAFVFRLVEVEAAHAPKSLDEPGVRERVVADLKKLQAYELLKQKADELLTEARDTGLVAFAEAHDAEVTPVQSFSGRRVNPRTGELDLPELPVVGNSEAFVNAVFTIGAVADDEGGLDQLPPAARITAVPVDGELLLAITQVTEYTPVTQAQYDTRESRLAGEMIMTNLQRVAGDLELFSRDAVIERVKYKSAFDDDDDAPAPADAPGSDADKNTTRPGGL